MKKILLTLSIPLALLIASCGGGDDTKDLKKVHIEVVGDTLDMFIPDTLVAAVELSENTYGATQVTIGSGFEILVEQLDADVSMKKIDIDGDEVYKKERFIINEPDFISWEVSVPGMEQHSFHFYGNVEVNGMNYSVSDNPEHAPFTEAQVAVMVDAVRSLK